MTIILRIPGRDLQAHFAERARVHQAKANAYGDQAAAVTKLDKPEPYMSGDPVQHLLAKAKEHAGKAAYFSLLARYVDSDTSHEVSPHEIAALELAEKIL